MKYYYYSWLLSIGYQGWEEEGKRLVLNIDPSIAVRWEASSPLFSAHCERG